MAVQTKTTTSTRLATLTSAEEQVYRMKRGDALEPGEKLEPKVTDNPRLAAEVAAIERGIFARLSAMARPGRADSPVKAKIIASLKSKK